MANSSLYPVNDFEAALICEFSYISRVEPAITVCKAQRQLSLRLVCHGHI